jgi:hypothetical protein
VSFHDIYFDMANVASLCLTETLSVSAASCLVAAVTELADDLLLHHRRFFLYNGVIIADTLINLISIGPGVVFWLDESEVRLLVASEGRGVKNSPAAMLAARLLQLQQYTSAEEIQLSLILNDELFGKFAQRLDIL